MEGLIILGVLILAIGLLIYLTAKWLGTDVKVEKGEWREITNEDIKQFQEGQNKTTVCECQICRDERDAYFEILTDRKPENVIPVDIFASCGVPPNLLGDKSEDLFNNSAIDKLLNDECETCSWKHVEICDACRHHNTGG